MTNIEHETIEAIRGMTRRVPIGPSVAELANEFGLTERAVRKRLLALRRKNLLEYDVLGRDIVK